MDNNKSIGLSVNNPEIEYDVFISYSFSDMDDAFSLCDYLQDLGLKCFVAQRNMPQSDPFASIIPWALERSRMMIAVLSQKFNDSINTGREIGIADYEGIPVLAVEIEKVELSAEKKYYFLTLPRIDATKGVDSAWPQIKDKCLEILQNLPSRKIHQKKTGHSWKTWFRRHRILTNFFLMIALVLGCLALFYRIQMYVKNNNNSNFVVLSAKGIVDNKNSVNFEESPIKSTAKEEKLAREAAYSRVIDSLSRDLDVYINKGNSSEINKLFCEIIDLSKKSKNVDEKMKALSKAIEPLPKVHTQLDDNTKTQIRQTVSDINLEKKNVQDYRDKVFFYRGIMYYYGIGSNDHKPDPVSALDCFKQVSDSSSALFYIALCKLSIGDYDDNEIIGMLGNAINAVEGGANKSSVSAYFYQDLKTDASYYLNRLNDLEKYNYSEPTEHYYITNTLQRQIQESFIEKIEKPCQLGKKTIYSKEDVALLLQAVDNLSGYHKAFAMHELAFCYKKGYGGLKKDNSQAKKLYEDTRILLEQIGMEGFLDDGKLYNAAIENCKKINIIG